MNRRFVRRFAALGALLACGAPLGLFFVLAVVDPDPARVLPVIYVYVGITTAIVFTAFGAFAGQLMDRLHARAVHDALTGAYTRRAFVPALARELAECQRRGGKTAVLMVDIDFFKRINDTHGHLVGDQTLVAVAGALQRNSRSADTLGRFGGEEFVLLCPHADEEVARGLAERLRGAVATLGRDALGHEGPVTVSIGVAVADDGVPDERALLNAADEALYEAKRNGRDRVVVAQVP